MMNDTRSMGQFSEKEGAMLKQNKLGGERQSPEVLTCEL